MSDVAAAGTQDTSGVVMREPGTARGTWAMQSLFEHLLESPESGGNLGVSLVTQPPGVATPLHRHLNEAEAFFVLDGTLDYQAGETLHHLHTGCFIYLPAGVPHAFRIRGDQPARVLALTTPGGLMSLYDEVGLPAQEHRLPGADGQSPGEEIAKWAQVAPRYGLQVVGPPLPE
ncbi:cupin domain-containing protein [Nocardioides sp.]|uniref:cupin domain-containing protein n=1 Tax=Nocardioides sp. TaxID=35761 RepID=UPI003D14D1F3